MIRVAICQFGEETNSFCKGRSTLKDLCPPDGRWCLGSEVEKMNLGTKTYICGALEAIRDMGAEAVPMDYPKFNGGNFLAGASMTAECVTDAVCRICDELRRRREEYDCIFFSMHGAAVSDLTDDVESYVLQEVRKVVGDMKIMGSLDNHANLSEEMVRLSDGFIGTKTVPHVDIYEAGYAAAEMLIRTVRGEIRPQMALRCLPMLTPGALGSTLGGVSKEIKDHMQAYAEEHGLLDATLFRGFSSADCACSGASVLVVADGYVPDREADELARFVWERREGFLGESNTAQQAVDKALALVKNGYVVINEGSDNPGAGCPGDGTHLLRELLRCDLPGSILGPLFDPEAARVCHTHAVGDRFPLTVGGHTYPELFGAPLELTEVTLLGLSDGDFLSDSPVNHGVTMHFGPSARLRAGNVEFVVVSALFQAFDDNVFRITGADMADYRVVCVKSANHFRAYFVPRADGIVGADTPGLNPIDLTQLTYRRVPRPIFPLDEDACYDGTWPKRKEL